MAVAAAILGADRFGVMGTVAGMALLGVNCGERGSDWDGVGASGRGWFVWEGSGWSRWFAAASPSIDLSLAPGYMVVLVGKVAVRTVTFLLKSIWQQLSRDDCNPSRYLSVREGLSEKRKP